MHTRQLPLVVDLDGTLIHSDMLAESALLACRARPLTLLQLPLWLMRGKAHLKQELARHAPIDLDKLPWNLPLLAWLRTEHASGRSLVLATASDTRYAQGISAHLGIFDLVLASDGHTNLSAERKRDQLLEHFGHQGFDYIGNSHDDLPVWQAAQGAILASTPATVRRRVARPVLREFKASGQALPAWGKALRLHQWVKNLLIFIPLLAAHQLDPASWLTALLGFIAFGLIASSVYLLNDLLDIEHDRHHARKRLRPFAAGALPIWQGAVLTPLMLAGGFGLAAALAPPFALSLCIYYALTLAYSLRLKRAPVLDVLALAGLYTMRIIAGAALSDVTLSYWLLSFSIFFFLSLGFLKRYVELIDRPHGGHLRGRGYAASDAPLISAQGVAAGLVSVLVLALYINSPDVALHYRDPRYLWGICLLLLYWLNRSWLLAHRGQMHDDPVVFALSDRVSLYLLCLSGALLAAATWTIGHA